MCVSSVLLTADCSNSLNSPRNLDFRPFNANSAYTTSSESSRGETRAPIITTTSKGERENYVNLWSEQQSLTWGLVLPSSKRSLTFTVSEHHLAKFSLCCSETLDTMAMVDIHAIERSHRNKTRRSTCHRAVNISG